MSMWLSNDGGMGIIGGGAPEHNLTSKIVGMPNPLTPEQYDELNSISDPTEREKRRLELIRSNPWNKRFH